MSPRHRVRGLPGQRGGSERDGVAKRSGVGWSNRRRPNPGGTIDLGHVARFSACGPVCPPFPLSVPVLLHARRNRSVEDLGKVTSQRTP